MTFIASESPASSLHRVLPPVSTLSGLLAAVVLSAACSWSFTGPSADTGTTAIQATATPSGNRGVYISVVDQDGAPLPARLFGNKSFEIVFSGRSVPADSIVVEIPSQSGQAVSSSLVLDYSGSMNADRAALETAAKAFVGNMGGPDRGEVIKFDDQVVVVQPFTPNKTLLLNAIPTAASAFGGSTALYDAVNRGIIDTAVESGQRAVVAFTDGAENASRTVRSASDLIARAVAASLPVYTIGFGSADAAELQAIATATGGRYYPAPTAAQFAAIYQQISTIFANTMRVSWPSFDNRPGEMVNITVTYYTSSRAQLTTTVQLTLR
jgi:Ca-activated chloride channel homolog